MDFGSGLNALPIKDAREGYFQVSLLQCPRCFEKKVVIAVGVVAN